MADTLIAPAEVADPLLADAQAAVDALEKAEPVVAAEPAKVEPVVAVVPEKYDLKLPDGSTLDKAVVERTAAIARELGLTNDAAQKLLLSRVADVTEHETARVAALDAMKPGGQEWIRINDEYKAAALADKELGNGDPAKLTVVAEKAQRALEKFFPDVSKEALEATQLASHPLFLKGLARIGAAMSEGTLVLGVAPSSKPPLAAGLYENEGRGPLPKAP